MNNDINEIYYDLDEPTNITDNKKTKVSIMKKEFKKLFNATYIENIFSRNDVIKYDNIWRYKFLGLDCPLSERYNIFDDNVEIGYISKNFKYLQSITKYKDYPIKYIHFIIVNKKFNINPKNENTLIITDGCKERYIDRTEFNNIVPLNNNKIDIGNIKNFYIIPAVATNTFSYHNITLSNFDEIKWWVYYIIHNKVNNDLNLIIYTKPPYVKEYKEFIYFLKNNFKKVILFNWIVTLGTQFGFIYCNNIKTSDCDIEKIRDTIDNYNYQIIKSKLYFYYEMIIINLLKSEPLILYKLTDIIQLIGLSDSINILKHYDISIDDYYKITLDHLKQNIIMDITNFTTLLPIISGDTNYKLIKYYKKMNISNNDITNVNYGINNIDNTLDIEIFDLCNNNFIMINGKSYKYDKLFEKVIPKYCDNYGISINDWGNNKYGLFISEINYVTFDNINNIDTDCIVIIRFNILDTHLYDTINMILIKFSERTIYVPYVNQIHNNYIYIILKNYKKPYNNKYIISIKNVISKYIINNKLPITYHMKLYGKHHFLNKYMKLFSDTL